MCEFKVYVIDDGGKQSLVAEDVVAAKWEDGKLVFHDILGIRVDVSGGLIEEVDVRTETMRVYRLSLAEHFMRFVKALAAYSRGELDLARLKEFWTRVREAGDEIIEDLERGKSL